MNLAAEIFRKIPLEVSEAVVRRCSSNMSSEKFRKFCTKIPVSQSLYNQVPGLRLGLQLD